MARIRTVKPEFWTDERIGEVSVSARLLFIACWTFADDEGGLDRSAKQLKAQAFPYDVIDCEPLVIELIKAGLLIEYEVSDRKYLHIKNFRLHQKIENPSKPRIPPYENSTNNPRALTETSPSPPPSSLRRESKGKDLLAALQDVPRETEDGWFLDFKLAYPHRAGDQGWRKAQKAANARIGEGHTTAEMIAGAKRYAAFCDATGKTGTEYVKQAATFLGPDKHFTEPWNIPKSEAMKGSREGLLPDAFEVARRAS